MLFTWSRPKAFRPDCNDEWRRHTQQCRTGVASVVFFPARSLGAQTKKAFSCGASHSPQKGILYPRFHGNCSEAVDVLGVPIHAQLSRAMHKGSVRESWHDSKLGCALIQTPGRPLVFVALSSVDVCRPRCLHHTYDVPFRVQSIRGSPSVVCPCQPAARPNLSRTLSSPTYQNKPRIDGRFSVYFAGSTVPDFPRENCHPLLTDCPWEADVETPSSEIPNHRPRPATQIPRPGARNPRDWTTLFLRFP